MINDWTTQVLPDSSSLIRGGGSSVAVSLKTDIYCGHPEIQGHPSEVRCPLNPPKVCPVAPKRPWFRVVAWADILSVPPALLTHPLWIPLWWPLEDIHLYLLYLLHIALTWPDIYCSILHLHDVRHNMTSLTSPVAGHPLLYMVKRVNSRLVQTGIQRSAFVAMVTPVARTSKARVYLEKSGP